MKRFIAVLLSTSLLTSPAFAAPKGISVQLGSIFSAPAGSEGLTLSGKNAIFIENIKSKSSDVVVTAVDMTGTQVWEKTIDSGADEVATAITTDPLGNIWIAGASAAIAPLETPTSLTGIDNPDGVVLDGGSPLRADMNQITLWKLTATGEVAATFSSPQIGLPQINAISATNSGVAIVGTLVGKPFLVHCVAGQFGKLFSFGTSKTEFNVVVRNSDGSASIFGSSAEDLVGKKLAGYRDGVLLKVSKTGAITSLVRSSAAKASRSWISGDSSNLVSGPVITGKVVETAVTKFSPVFSPQWTLRMPSAGPSVTLSANGNSYLAFTSRAAIVGVTGWKPTTPTLIVITYDSKGAMRAATALPGLVTPLSLSFSPARGVTGLASAGDGTVSIFSLVSR